MSENYNILGKIFGRIELLNLFRTWKEMPYLATLFSAHVIFVMTVCPLFTKCMLWLCSFTKPFFVWLYHLTPFSHAHPSCRIQSGPSSPTSKNEIMRSSHECQNLQNYVFIVFPKWTDRLGGASNVIDVAKFLITQEFKWTKYCAWLAVI